jgi:hypothetical protein
MMASCHLFDRLVAQDLASGGELASSSNEDRLWGAVGEHGRVDQGLVVHLLVDLGRLRLVVHDEGAAKGSRLDHLHRNRIQHATAAPDELEGRRDCGDRRVRSFVAPGPSGTPTGR